MIDYMVMEAVLIKVQQQQEEAEKAAKNKEWRSNRDHLKQYQ